MIVCKYDRLIATKANFPEVVAEKEFKTVSIKSAIDILIRWNNLGRIKNKIVKIDWIYCIRAITKATLQQIDDDAIPFYTVSNC